MLQINPVIQKNAQMNNRKLPLQQKTGFSGIDQKKQLYN